MTVQTPVRLTIPAFFDWIEDRDEKYELVEGVPCLQPWVKRNHNRITVNLIAALSEGLEPNLYEIAGGDFAVATGPNTIRYADVMVEPAGGAGHERASTDAIVLVEVLSDSTAHTDFGEKLTEYQTLSRLRDYIVLDQERPIAWHWERDDSDVWSAHPAIVEGIEKVLTIGGLAVELPMERIYRGVTAA